MKRLLSIILCVLLLTTTVPIQASAEESQLDTQQSDILDNNASGTDTSGSDESGSDEPGGDELGSDVPGSDVPGTETADGDVPGSDDHKKETHDDIKIETKLAANGILIDETNFPDINFRNYVAENIDADKSGVLSDNEILLTTEINVNKCGIADLKGIEHFTALENLSCQMNELVSLDVSKNTALTKLDCMYNKINGLNTENNTGLLYLLCGQNNISSLNLGKNTVLTELNCAGCNLGNLDLSKNTALTKLNCITCGLSELDLSGNTALTELDCMGNKLSNLDLSNQSELTKLYCENNLLQSLDLSNNNKIKYLSCSNNSLKALNLANFSALENLDCFDNILNSLNLSGCTALKNLYCGNNKLQNLDISSSVLLEDLNCAHNQISSLNIANNKALKSLNCSENCLTSLNIRNNTVLGNVSIDNNILSSSENPLDLSKLPGFDVNMTSKWRGGYVNGNILSAPYGGDIRYDYNIGNGKFATFTLRLSPMPVSYASAHIKMPVAGGRPAAQVLFPDEVDEYEYGDISWFLGDENSTDAMGTGERFVKDGLYTCKFDLYAISDFVFSKDVCVNIDFSLNGDPRSKITPSGYGHTVSADGKIISCWARCYVKERPIYEGISIDEVNFPDVNFRNFVSENIDKDRNGGLSGKEYNEVLHINVPGKNIESLAGIEYFPHLISLSCGYNELTAIDLSKNRELVGLSCSENYLTSLNLSNSINNFDYFECNNNRLELKERPFDLSTLSGFDISRASSWQGAVPEGNLLSAPNGTEVKYTYDCGKGQSAVFTIVFNVEDVVKLEETGFPDAELRNYIANNIDKDGSGGLSQTEIDNTTAIDLSGLDVEKLKGLEKFTALKSLKCTDCKKLSEVTIPQKIESIQQDAFSGCELLAAIEIPANISELADRSFMNCTNLKEIRFTGNAPVIGNEAFLNVSADVYTPEGNSSWTEDKIQNYGGKLSWNPGENRLEFSELPGESTVYIDGKAMSLDANSKLDYEGNTGAAVSYTYNTESDEVHAKYPTGLDVWIIKEQDGKKLAVREERLDDVLKYSGSSIRITGKKGIRMITSVPESLRTALTEGSIDGLTLQEYGTVVAWDTELSGRDLTLELDCAKSNHAYKKGESDPIFKDTGTQIQYTNVLVGFTNEQCIPDLAMRPYIKLADAEGNMFTIYGGTVHRSIGYIAYQNRNFFNPGSDAYAYIWDIIHYVYGDKYDSEYKG